MKKLVVRTITGVLVLIASIFLTYKGSYYLLGLSLFLSFFALQEIDRVLQILDIHQNLAFLSITNVIIIIAALYENVSLILVILSILLMGLLATFTLFDHFKLEDVFAHLFSILYIALPFSMMFLLHGSKYIWLIYICAWGTDTFAYVFGNLFGRHKLIPKVSPKKTVEGSIGGMISVGIIAYIYAIFMHIPSPFLIVIIGVLGSAIGQIGDLCASKLKRMAKVKDYGNIFLGHGGVLDRYDSILFTTPYVFIVYLLLS